MLDSPWESQGGVEIGSVDINADSSTDEITTVKTELPELDGVTGKHALYMLFYADNNEELADLYDFRFKLTGENPVTPTPIATKSPDNITSTTDIPKEQPQLPSASPDIPSVKKGNVYKVGKYTYKVMSVNENGGGTVSIVKPSSKKIVVAIIPASIIIDGKKYDVTQIGKRAFAGCKKLRKVVIKTKKLNKVGASCFKGIYKKAVIRVPKVKYKEYVKLLKRKGQKKGVNIRR